MSSPNRSGFNRSTRFAHFKAEMLSAMFPSIGRISSKELPKQDQLFVVEDQFLMILAVVTSLRGDPESICGSGSDW